jgi:hypothetical protein
VRKIDNVEPLGNTPGYAITWEDNGYTENIIDYFLDKDLGKQQTVLDIKVRESTRKYMVKLLEETGESVILFNERREWLETCAVSFSEGYEQALKDFNFTNFSPA